MKTIKRVGSIIKNSDFVEKHKEKYMLDLIKQNQGNGYMRKGNFSSEIIWDGKSYMFPPKGKAKSFRKGLFLFGMVRKDAKAFIKGGKTIKVPNQYPVNEYNENFTKLEDKITGTDLNHAYWRIAYNLGVISKNTYFKGLDDEYKVVRLSALSTLGKGKDYFVIKDGEITDEVVKIGLDEQMDNEKSGKSKIKKKKKLLFHGDNKGNFSSFRNKSFIKNASRVNKKDSNNINDDDGNDEDNNNDDDFDEEEDEED